VKRYGHQQLRSYLAHQLQVEVQVQVLTSLELLSLYRWSKNRNPGFHFAITSVNVHFLIILYCHNKKCMTHKSKITPATSPLFCNPYLVKHTLLLKSMLHFRMCNILKFTQNSLVVLIPYLLIPYSDFENNCVKLNTW